MSYSYYWLLDWKIILMGIMIIFLIMWLFLSSDDVEFLGFKNLFGEEDENESEVDYSDSEYESEENISNIKIVMTDITDDRKSSLRKSGKRVRKNHHSKIDLEQNSYIFNKKPIIPQVSFSQNRTIVKTEKNKIKNKKDSQGEQITRETMERIYGVPFTSQRPDFLKNPRTGENLELDCYNAELKIAAEYNGIQHYIWPNYTGQSEEEFHKQLSRDEYKVNQCDLNGVYLITIPYQIPFDEIPSYINYYLPENVAARQEMDPEEYPEVLIHSIT